MKLEDIDKKNPFTVPDNYFDNFYANLEKRIKDEPKKQKTLFLYFRPLIAVAASIIIAFLIFNPLNVADSKISKNEQSVIIDYENLENFDEYDLYTAMSQTEEVKLSDEDIADYISSEYSDYEIYAELNK